MVSTERGTPGIVNVLGSDRCSSGKVESQSVAALLPCPDPISGSPPSCPALPRCFVLRLPIYIVRSDYLFSLKPLYFGLTLPLRTDSTQKLPARLSRLESIIFVQHNNNICLLETMIFVQHNNNICRPESIIFVQHNRTKQQVGRTNR